ncbi:uncharacterized protein SCHCODRAFT_02534210 [Schizophyllum commune H4-8]|uniref:F-box domain-containing protein n=1 Tax=Schizophyllum commune (strain H4-8 / FGSC 9210) TaxID=578458 RepID=D8PY82_SCHCM|nr:uncharacterized protein SCHCODRAFT_02534210 [Schizophyllum commune H4-8]KAI5897221.1 hypothetical protein SCHCODRAFT_02534210 [Schizophyllum commune H4-8]
MHSGISVDNVFVPPLGPEHEVATSPASWPLVAPIHRLPIELLSRVFVELSGAQVDQFKHKSDERYVPHLMTITAASVCKRWRAVARGTPDLWASIYVNKKTRHVEAFLDACILNSGRRSLDLHCSSKKLLPTFLSRLLPHNERWEHLSISAGETTPLAVLCTSRYSFGALKELHLEVVTMPSGTWDFLANAPRLEELCVTGSSTRGRVIIPPMYNLRRVEYHVMYEVYHVSSIFDAVAHSRETLESLYLSFNCSPSDLELGQPVLMPALAQLDLDWTCQVFMKSIIAPNLTDIVNVCPHDELSTPRLVLTLITHPQADPRSLGLLDLQALYVLDEELSRTLLQALTLMVNLEPATPHRSDTLLVGLSLAKHHGVPPILPLLSKLSFGIEPFLSADELARQRRLLLDVVRSRMEPKTLDGQAFVALRGFASSIELPELRPKVEEWSCTAQYAYIGN